MDVFSIDFETSSETDIDLGAYRYNNCPSTTVLLVAIKKNDEPVLLWDYNDPDGDEGYEALLLMREAAQGNCIIRAFNAQFEIACWRYVVTRQFGIKEPPLDVWRCTQAMCNCAAIRVNLKDATTDIGLPELKDKGGRALIGIFSDRTKEISLSPPEGMKDPDSIKTLKSGKQTAGRKPKNRKTFSPIHDEEILWDWLVKVDGDMMTVRDAWKRFGEYCRRDVIAESTLAARLSRFELKGDMLAAFQFDMRMNYKGVPVNRDALAKASKLVEQAGSRMETRFQNLTGMKSTQGKKLLPWLKERGYRGDNLQAETIEEELENTSHMTKEGAEALKMRSMLSFASLSKIPKMLATACDDGYVRGTTKFHGARTGRATGSLMQPHNAKKSTIEGSRDAYDIICSGGGLELIDEFWSSPLEVISSCIRHFIQWLEGNLFDCDYTGVEGRIAPWLADERGKLESILAGEDQYKIMASEIAFNIPYDQVTKAQRQIGKVIELQCIYGAGGKGLRKSLAKMDVIRSAKQCAEDVFKYRRKFANFKKAWDDMQAAAIAAIQDNQITQVCNGRIAFGCLKTAGIRYLVMRLPGGRRMYYPHPEVKRVFREYDEEDMLEDPRKREKGGYWMDSISFYGKQPMKAFWGRVHTWGSRLFENAVQAIGADLLNYGCIQAEKQGYDIRMIIHDQILALDNGLPIEQLVKAFCSKQPWAETFPLEATGDVVPFYLKED